VTLFPDERGSELRDLFFETAQELLQSLNDDALKLEKSPQDSEVIRSIRRTVHTLKGDSAAAGFAELSELAHMLEDALAIETPPPGVSLAELGFTAADTFGAMLAAYQRQVRLPDPAPLKSFVALLAGGRQKPTTKKSAAPTAPAVWTEYERLAADAARREGKKVLHIVARIDPLCAMPVAARQLLANALASVAQILGSRPEPGAAIQGQCLDLLLATSQAQSAILAKCQIPTVIANAECFVLAPQASATNAPEPNQALNQESAEAAEETGSAAAESGPARTRSAASETILRVDAERIDNVLNLVGELIIAKSMMQQAMQEFGRRLPKDSLRARFADAMGFQARVLNDLQRSVMKIRMVPVEQLFRRFPRLVRDAAQRCNKQVELVISGHDTDLDKSLLDAIAEPLTHIVRNAVSHGIETPEQRRKAGKPATGTVRLDAYHQANQLIVEVADDGHGIEVEKIKTKGIKTGLITTEAVAKMTQAEILDLIFRPGFSTAEEITEISGRGVGLDVVRSVLHRLKGTVDLESRPGQGTTFRLKLPLTLAIIKALLFRIEGKLYAIPLNTVSEIARTRESDLHMVDNWEVVQLRGQVLPLLRLGQKPSNDGAEASGKFFVLVINFGRRKLGLIVDSLEGEEELVIKALDDETVATDLVSGASILGDGRVVLIMNLAAVVERFTAPVSGTSSGSLVVPTSQTGNTSLEALQ
jgi:two-component system chemotaxis sensor kinase CheA